MEAGRKEGLERGGKGDNIQSTCQLCRSIFLTVIPTGPNGHFNPANPHRFPSEPLRQHAVLSAHMLDCHYDCFTLCPPPDFKLQGGRDHVCSC